MKTRGEITSISMNNFPRTNHLPLPTTDVLITLLEKAGCSRRLMINVVLAAVLTKKMLVTRIDRNHPDATPKTKRLEDDTTMEHSRPDDRIVQLRQANASPTLLKKTNAVVMIRAMHRWIKHHPLRPKVLMTPDWNIARLLCDFDDATITKIRSSCTDVGYWYKNHHR
jgi:hypothetical protein